MCLHLDMTGTRLFLMKPVPTYDCIKADREKINERE